MLVFDTKFYAIYCYYDDGVDSSYYTVVAVVSPFVEPSSRITFLFWPEPELPALVASYGLLLRFSATVTYGVIVITP